MSYEIKNDFKLKDFENSFKRELEKEVNNKDFTFSFENATPEDTTTYKDKYKEFHDQNDKIKTENDKIINKFVNNTVKSDKYILHDLNSDFQKIMNDHFSNPKDKHYNYNDEDVTTLNAYINELKLLTSKKFTDNDNIGKLNNDYLIVELQSKFNNYITDLVHNTDVKDIDDMLLAKILEITTKIEEEKIIIDTKTKYDENIRKIDQIYNTNLTKVNTFLQNFDFKNFVKINNLELYEQAAKLKQAEKIIQDEITKQTKGKTNVRQKQFKQKQLKQNDEEDIEDKVPTIIDDNNNDNKQNIKSKNESNLKQVQVKSSDHTHSALYTENVHIRGQNDTLNAENEKLKRQYKNINDTHNALKTEKQKLEDEYNLLRKAKPLEQDKTEELNKKIQQLEKKIQQLEKKIKDKETEIESLKSKNQNEDTKLQESQFKTELNKYSTKKRELESEVFNLTTQKNEVKNENEANVKLFNENKTKLEKQILDIKAKQKEYDEKLKEYSELDKAYKNSKEIQKQNNLKIAKKIKMIAAQEQQIQDNANKIAEQAKQKEEFDKVLKELLARNEKVMKEINDEQIKKKNENEITLKQMAQLLQGLDADIENQTKKLNSVFVEKTNKEKEMNQIKKEILSKKNEYTNNETKYQEDYTNRDKILQQLVNEVTNLKNELSNINTNIQSKKTELQKLEDATSTKVNSIRTEIVNQMATNIKNELALKESEIARIVFEKQKIEQNLTDKKIQIEELQKANRNVKQQIEQITNENIELQTKLDKNTEKQKLLENDINNVNLKNSELQNQIVVSEEKSKENDNLTQKINELKTELEKNELLKKQLLEEANKSKENTIYLTEEQHTKLLQDLKIVHEKLTKIQAELVDATHKTAELQKSLVEATNKTTGLQTSLDAATTEKEELQAELDAAIQEKKVLETSLTAAIQEKKVSEEILVDANNKTTELETSLAAATNKTTELETALAAATNKTVELQKSLETATTEKGKLQAELDAATAEKEELQSKLQTATNKTVELQEKLAEANKNTVELETLLVEANKNTEELVKSLAESNKNTEELQAKLAAGIQEKEEEFAKKIAELETQKEANQQQIRYNDKDIFIAFLSQLLKKCNNTTMSEDLIKQITNTTEIKQNEIHIILSLFENCNETKQIVKNILDVLYATEVLIEINNTELQQFIYVATRTFHNVLNPILSVLQNNTQQFLNTSINHLQLENGQPSTKDFQNMAIVAFDQVLQDKDYLTRQNTINFTKIAIDYLKNKDLTIPNSHDNTKDFINMALDNLIDKKQIIYENIIKMLDIIYDHSVVIQLKGKDTEFIKNIKSLLYNNKKVVDDGIDIVFKRYSKNYLKEIGSKSLNINDNATKKVKLQEFIKNYITKNRLFYYKSTTLNTKTIDETIYFISTPEKYKNSLEYLEEIQKYYGEQFYLKEDMEKDKYAIDALFIDNDYLKKYEDRWTKLKGKIDKRIGSGIKRIIQTGGTGIKNEIPEIEQKYYKTEFAELDKYVDVLLRLGEYIINKKISPEEFYNKYYNVNDITEEIEKNKIIKEDSKPFPDKILNNNNKKYPYNYILKIENIIESIVKKQNTFNFKNAAIKELSDILEPNYIDNKRLKENTKTFVKIGLDTFNETVDTNNNYPIKKNTLGFQKLAINELKEISDTNTYLAKQNTVKFKNSAIEKLQDIQKRMDLIKHTKDFLSNSVSTLSDINDPNFFIKKNTRNFGKMSVQVLEKMNNKIRNFQSTNDLIHVAIQKFNEIADKQKKMEQTQVLDNMIKTAIQAFNKSAGVLPIGPSSNGSGSLSPAIVSSSPGSVSLSSHGDKTVSIASAIIQNNTTTKISDIGIGFEGDEIKTYT